MGWGTYLHHVWLGWELRHGAQLRLLWGYSWVEVTIACRCALQERAESITTFALCGFANLSSIGIMLGGLGEHDPCPRCLGMMQGDPGPREQGLSCSRRNFLPSSLHVRSLPAHR